MARKSSIKNSDKSKSKKSPKVTFFMTKRSAKTSPIRSTISKIVNTKVADHYYDSDDEPGFLQSVFYRMILPVIPVKSKRSRRY